MASSPKSNEKTPKVLCVEFNEHGFCKKGSECTYLHKDKDFKMKPAIDYLIASTTALNGIMIVMAKELVQIKIELNTLKEKDHVFKKKTHESGHHGEVWRRYLAFQKEGVNNDDPIVHSDDSLSTDEKSQDSPAKQKLNSTANGSPDQEQKDRETL